MMDNCIEFGGRSYVKTIANIIEGVAKDDGRPGSPCWARLGQARGQS